MKIFQQKSVNIKNTLNLLFMLFTNIWHSCLIEKRHETLKTIFQINGQINVSRTKQLDLDGSVFVPSSKLLQYLVILGLVQWRLAVQSQQNVGRSAPLSVAF